jgi:ABC-type bacteriocin/lantibiotic exporter with double-glycine peptidase domain
VPTAVASSSPATGQRHSTSENGDVVVVTDPVWRDETTKPPSTVFSLVRYVAFVSRIEPFVVFRLFGALALIFLSKMIGLRVPLLLKSAVDALGRAPSTEAIPALVTRSAFASLLLHGVAKALASLTAEGRTMLFAPSGQRLARRFAASAFAHILSLETEFHSASSTGALTRVVDRATRSVLVIVRSVMFAFMPSAFELALVCGVLLKSFSWPVVCVVVLTFIAYVAATVAMNNVLARLRIQMNSADTQTSGMVTDALLNTDIVSLFSNRNLEIRRLDKLSQVYERIATENEVVYGLLNFVQTLIFTAGLTVVLVVCSQNVIRGAMTVGDLVYVSGLMTQVRRSLSF